MYIRVYIYIYIYIYKFIYIYSYVTLSHLRSKAALWYITDIPPLWFAKHGYKYAHYSSEETQQYTINNTN